MSKRSLLKKILSDSTEKELEMKFFQKGRDYYIDEILILDLYNIHKNKKPERYVMTYDDKKDINKAYPGLFNFQQVNLGYKITKRIE